MAPKPLKRNAKIGIAVGIATAVGIVITVLCFLFLGSKSPDTKTLPTSSTNTDSNVLEEFSALVTPEGNLEDNNLKKFKEVVSSLPSDDRAKVLVTRPELIKVVITNNMSVDFTKLDTEQRKVLEEELGKVEKDPKLSEPVKSAAKKKLEEIKIKNENNPKGAQNKSNQQVGQDQGTGDTGPEEDIDKSTDQPTVENGQPDTQVKFAEPIQEPPKQTSEQKQSMDSTQFEALLAKLLLTPKEADQLLKEINTGKLLKPDGSSKYIPGDIQPKCSIAPLIKPLLEAADPKTLPDLAPIRNTTNTVLNELKEETDATIKGYFGDFNYADDNAVLVSHLGVDIENLKGNILAARFALLQSIDPTTYTNVYAKDTLLKNVLSATPEEVWNNLGLGLEEFFTSHKELIELIDGSIDVNQKITEAKAVPIARDEELQDLLDQNFLKPDDAKKALDLATKTKKNVKDEIKKKCELSTFIADLMNSEDPKNIPDAATITDVKNKVKDMRTIIAALPNTDPKPFYESFMKSAAGPFANEGEAIEACLEKDVKTITGKKLVARCYLLNSFNKKYDKAYFKNTILDGALSKSPEDLKKIQEFEIFLSEREMLIREFNLINSPETLRDIIENAERSGLSQADLDAIAEVHKIFGKKNIDAADYGTIKNAIAKENWNFYSAGQKLTLSNLDENYSKKIMAEFESIEKQRQALLDADDQILVSDSAQDLIDSLANLKLNLSTNLADIQKQFPEPEIQTCDPKAYVEKMLTADIKDLKGRHLLTRYLILNEHDSAKFDEKFARETMIGTEVLGYKQDDLETDVRKLAKLRDKEWLCREVNHEINGDSVETVILDVIQSLTNKFRVLPDILEERGQVLKSEPNMLRAALLGYLGPVAIYLDRVDTPTIDAAFEDLPYKKDSVKKAIDLQQSINERKRIRDGLPPSEALSANGQSFASILSDYLMSPGAEYLPIHHPMLDRTCTMDELVIMTEDSERDELFDAIIRHDKSAFDSMWIAAYQGMKFVVFDEIVCAVGILNYNKTTFEKRVEQLKKIILKKPFSAPIPYFMSGQEVNEQSVESVVADHFSDSILGTLGKAEVAKTFDCNMLKNYIEICRTLNVPKYFRNMVGFLIALKPVLTFLNECPDDIDFGEKDLNAPVPVKTFASHMSDHPEYLLDACEYLFFDVLYEKSANESTTSFYVHMILVPLFASLPSLDLSHLSKVRDDEIKLYNDMAFELHENSDSDLIKTYLNALIKLGSPDDQKSKKNILFLWGTLDKMASCDDKRARLVAICKASATDVPKEIIALARARLLSSNNNETDLALKALYKSYYDAVKSMYTPKVGEVLDQVFPDEW